MKSLIIEQKWDDTFIDILKREKIESINYNPYLEGDIEFLEKLSDFPIRNFILQTPRIKNIKPLQYLRHLECLCIDQDYTDAPDFSQFEKLWWVGGKWRAKGKSILKSKRIRRLGLRKSPFETLEPFLGMSQLESLSLGYGKLKSLKGIDKLPSLSEFDIMLCRSLESLEGVQYAPKLTKENTVITRCRQITPESPLAEYVTFDDLI